MANQDGKYFVIGIPKTGTISLLALLIAMSHFATVDTKRGGSSGGRGGSSSSSGGGGSSSSGSGHSSSSSSRGGTKIYRDFVWWEIMYVGNYIYNFINMFHK